MLMSFCPACSVLLPHTLSTAGKRVPFCTDIAEGFPGRFQHPILVLSEAWDKKFKMKSGTTMTDNYGHFSFKTPATLDFDHQQQRL